MRKFYLLMLLCSLGVLSGRSQTTLIDPAGAGGFNLGSTFAANGWTLVNTTGTTTPTNTWRLGSVPTLFSGSNPSAFVSNDGGVSHAYTVSPQANSSIVHFYRDVTFPAGQTSVALSFQWYGGGEATTVWFDVLQVSIAPTSVTPVAEANFTGGLATPFTPVVAGSTVIGSYYLQTTPVQTVNVTIPASAVGNATSATTMRLIFTWRNDQSSGTQPPAAVDNISLITGFPPAAPISFSSNTATNTGFNISWADNSVGETNFLVYRSLSPTGPFALVSTVPSTSSSTTGAAYTLPQTGLFANTTYYYEIKAADAAGTPSTALTGTATTTACPGGISGVKNIPGDYPSLTAAMGDLQVNGISGPVTLQLGAGYTSAGETFPITISNGGCFATSSTNTLTIMPTVSGIVIEGNNAGPTIDINGSSYVTIDGRVGGAGAMDMQITNTNAGGAALRFINDASFNTIQYCNLRGQNTATTSTSLTGVVYFSTASTANLSGNDNNTISNCDIHATAAGFPAMGVSAHGSVTSAVAYNDNNTITNCNIYDFFNAANSSTGVKLNEGCQAWTISGNSFYQTIAREYTAAVVHRAIWVTPNPTAAAITLGSGSTITNNYIGGTSPFAGGGPMTLTANAATLGVLYWGMDISVGFGAATQITGNTVANIVLNTGSTGSPSFAGISQNAGNVTIAQNTIGDMNNPTAIVINRTGTSTTVGTAVGIRITGSTNATNIVDGNNIGGIVTNSATATIGHSIIGVNVTGGTTNNIINNIIGSQNAPLNTSNVATTGAQSVTGISVTGGTANTVSGNTVSYLNNAHTGTGAALARGILVSAGVATVSNNTIHDLLNSTASTSAGASASTLGIAMTSTTAGSTVSGNTIYYLKSTAGTAGTANVNVVGMFISAATTGNNVVSRNFIHSLSTTTTGTGAFISGMDIGGGALNVVNNMIHLGFNENAASITAPVSVRGITRGGTLTASNFYHNSVYIGGDGVSTAATTNTYAFQRNGTVAATDNVMNNIFVNERSNAGAGGGKHYAVYFLTNTTNLALNYNIYRVTGTGGFAGFNGTTDLAAYAPAWIAGDINSIGADPGFVNTFAGGGSGIPDLHITTSAPTPVEATGTPIASVTDDFDGQARASATPTDIGADADNFISANPPVINSVSISPTINQCTPTARTITADITEGASPLTTVVINYSFNGVQQTPEPMMFMGGTFWTGTIPAAPAPNVTVTWSVSAIDATFSVGMVGTAYEDGGPEIVAGGNPTVICSGSSVTLTALQGTAGTAAIGTQSTTEGTNHPFRSGLGAPSKHQLLYTASELQAAGLAQGPLTGIGFTFTTAGTGTLANYTIGIKNTTATALTTTYDAGPFTTVLSGLTLTSTDLTVGLHMLNFTTPFIWDGVSNILVNICYDNTVSGGSGVLAATTPATIRNVGSLGVANACTQATGSTGANRPLTTFSGILGSGAGSLNWTWNPGGLTGNQVTVNPVNATSAPITATYTVTATDPVTTCSTNASVNITVNPIPAAPTANNSVQCGVGVPTASVTGGGGTYRWYNQPTGGTMVQASGSTYTGTINTTTTFYVSEFNGNCEGPRTAVTATVTQPDPIDAQASATSICPNTPTNLSVVQTGTTQNYAYTWNVTPVAGSGMPAPVSGSTVNGVTPTVAGTYKYYVTGVDGICTIVDTVSVTVNPQPSIVASGNPTAVCSGNTVTLTGLQGAPGTAALGTQSTTESGNHPFRSGLGLPSKHQMLYLASELQAAGFAAGPLTSIGFTFTAAGTGTMSNYTIGIKHTSATAVTTTYDAGPFTTVLSGVTLTTADLTVGLHTLTFTTPFVWDGTSNILVNFCYDNPVIGGSGTLAATTPASVRNVGSLGVASACTLTTGTTGANRPLTTWGGILASGAGSLTWTWNPGGLTGNQVTVNPVNATSAPVVETYTVTATNPVTTCSSTATVNITVNPLPAAPTATNSIQCGAGIPTASVAGASGSYRWYNQPTGGTLLQTGGTTYTTAITATTTFYVSDFNGTCESVRTPVVATVTQPDALDAIASSTAFCPGGSTNLSVTQTGSTQNYTYTWNVTPVAGSGMPAPVSGGTVNGVTPTAPGVYKYYITGVDGSCTAVDTVTVFANPNPVVSATATPSTVCSGDNVTLAAIEGIPSNVTVGTQTTTIGGDNGNPYRTSSGTDVKVQILVTASELTALGISAGYINSLGFTATGVGTNTVNNFTISLGLTTASSLSTTFAVAPMTTVFTQAAFSPVVGVNMHTFSTPFYWDGTSNLLVQVCQSNSGATTTTVAAYVPTYTSTVTSTAASACSATTGATSNKPVMHINGISGALNMPLSWVWTPGNLTGSPVMLNPTNNTSSQTNETYTVTATNTATGCSSTANASFAVNPIQGLAANGTNNTSQQPDGTTQVFTDASCNLIAKVTDAAGGVTLGNVTSGVIVDATVQSANGQPYVQRHYNITPTNNGAAIVTLYATQTEFNAFNIAAASTTYPLLPLTGSNSDPNIGNIRVTKFTGAAPAPGTGTLLTPTSVFWNGNWWEITVSVPTFSSFYIHTGSTAPLTIELTDIIATNIGERNRVDWSTANERTGDKFEVERSIDGRNFTFMGTVEAKGTPSSYSFWDNQPVAGINYYRLKLVDVSGTYAYSDVVNATVRSGESFFVEAFPNPVSTEQLTVRANGTVNGTATVSITDVTGKVISVHELKNGIGQINVSKLTPGIYLVKYDDGTHKQTIRVNKL